MKYIVHLLIAFLPLYSCSQALISENSWFLDSDPSGKYIIYFKSDSITMDEYIEGQIFIHDVNENRSYSLNNEIYILAFINVSWSSSEKTFFMSTGSSLDFFSFETNKVNTLYSTSENGLITSVTVSDNGNLIALNEKVINENETTHIFYLIDIKNNITQEIFRIEDSSIGESLTNGFIFDPSNENVYISTITNELINLYISSKEHYNIDSNITDIFCATEGKLYYLKDDKLIQYNIENNESIAILEGRDLHIQYVGSHGDSIILNFNDNVFIYDEFIGLTEVEKLPKGYYVFIKNGIAVESRDNCLYLHNY